MNGKSMRYSWEIGIGVGDGQEQVQGRICKERKGTSQ